MQSKLYKFLFFLFLLFPLPQVVLAEAIAASTLTFDSRKMAAFEVNMWQAYYRKDYIALSRAIQNFLIEQFHITRADAIIITVHAAKAVRIFSILPNRTTKQAYEKKVLPALTAAFIHLRLVTGGKWDAKKVARAELRWWVTRRSNGLNQVKKVGQQIARVYGLLYGKSNRYIERAGYLRAKAAALRDRQSRRGRIDWQAIETVLQQSYEALYRGMHEISE